MTIRIVAVDWSGAAHGEAKKIAFAEASDGRLVRLRRGMTREQVVQELIATRASGDRLVAGLDFGFSMPVWYLGERGFRSSYELWAWLAEEGCADALLRDCAHPFWGRAGRKRPAGIEQYRRTERAVEACERVRPKSVFQIGGGGAVGTGSLRGMCALHALHHAGFAAWPFDVAGAATVIEIYPRLFTGPVKKSNAVARERFLDAFAGCMSAADRAAARESEDAFDAAISAIVMSRHAQALAALPSIDDALLRLEGIIWWPRWREAHRVMAAPILD